MKMDFTKVDKIAEWRLCVGCGACKYICPKNNIHLVDVIDQGIRPLIINLDECGACDDCIRVCPGYENAHDLSRFPGNLIKNETELWGPIIQVFEGYASDPELRHYGSSGGLTSAIALYCLEHKDMSGVLHIGQDANSPLNNITCLSRNRLDLLSRTGSRYSPASPCDGLAQIESDSQPCVFVGKPCDVAALRKAQKMRDTLNKKIGVALGIFCAGTPSLMGTIKLLEELKIDPNSVGEIRNRGKGWPGMFTVRLKGLETPSCKIPYMKSWSFLQKFRPFRCHLCPDGTSEFADISCGDPWHRTISDNEHGYSLVLVRTEKGQEILEGAIRAGYVTLERADPVVLRNSQKGMIPKKGEIWGRLLTMKIFGIPTPQLKGFFLFKNWLALPVIEKMRSLLGTARRIIQRKYYLPFVINSK